MNTKFSKVISFMIGILISIAGTAMLISGSFNLKRFYDVGKVCDIPEMERTVWSGAQFNYETGHLEFLEEKVIKNIVMEGGKQRRWNYLYITVSIPENEDLELQITCRDKTGADVYQKNQTLVTGKNCITTEDVNYSSTILEIQGKVGNKVGIEKIQFREQEEVFTWHQAVMYFSLIFVGYVIIIWIGKKIIDKKNKKIHFSLDPFLKGLELWFIRIGDTLGGMAGEMSKTLKKRIRVGVILFLFFYMQIMSMTSLYLKESLFKWHMLVCIIAVILLCIFSWERPLQRIHCNKRFVKIWFIFWVMAAISEFVVPKRFGYQGLIMIFVVTPFFLIWNNMEDRDEILRNFQSALEWWFWINVPLCYFKSPYTEGIRYLGISKNPNIWAMSLIFVSAVFLGKAEKYSDKKGLKNKCHGVLNFVAIGILWDFIVKTGSSSGLIPMVIMSVFWGMRQLVKMRKQDAGGERILYLAGGILIVIFFTCINDWALRNIADENTITQSDYELEVFNENMQFFSLKVQASELEKVKNNRVYQKIFYSGSMESFTTGRTLFWKEYIRDLNLWGNTFAPTLRGRRISSHNAMLAVAYRYGIFSIIPYSILIVYYLFYAFKYREQAEEKEGMEFFIKSVAVNVVILMMMENVEFPFYYISWYAFYFIIGRFFGNESGSCFFSVSRVE